MPERILDMENIGRIGLMFIDGDLLAKVLKDPYTCDEDDTNYDIPAFNCLKKALMKTERMNPDKYLTGVLWQRYPANKLMASPAVAGKSMPWKSQSWMITKCAPALYEAMESDKLTSAEFSDGRRTLYFPVKSSSGEIVGALELTEGAKPGAYEKTYA